MVTRRVEVLQVQRVVPRLVVIPEAKLAFATLELNRKDGWSGNQHRIDSAAEPRHFKLQVQRARKPVEGSPKEIELLFPGLALLNLEGVGVRSSEGAEDLVRLGREKAFD